MNVLLIKEVILSVDMLTSNRGIFLSKRNDGSGRSYEWDKNDKTWIHIIQMSSYTVTGSIRNKDGSTFLEKTRRKTLLKTVRVDDSVEIWNGKGTWKAKVLAIDFTKVPPKLNVEWEDGKELASVKIEAVNDPGTFN